jgi:hypothetical protein
MLLAMAIIGTIVVIIALQMGVKSILQRFIKRNSPKQKRGKK